MQEVAKANRIHIGFFGRCNAGKSTLINLLTDQSIALVSPIAGTTTDPVTKSMEILPLGPVMIIDTAGVDDTSELGPLRMEKTREVVSRINMAVYVIKTNEAPTEADIEWLERLKDSNVPTLLLLNEVDGISGKSYLGDHRDLALYGATLAMADITDKASRRDLLETLSKMKPVDDEEQTLLEGIIEAGDIMVLVCPIDSAAPKGRLILPQVQMIREVLDYKGMAYVSQVEELEALLASLKQKPKLVITDSQAFDEVSQIVPTDIPLTSFSILMARFKGKLKDLVQGVRAIHNLKPGSKVLISEGCTHHRQCDDIGTVKIPMWLKKKGYTDLELEWTSGGQFPQDVSAYDLIIHCGACMLTRREVLRRIDVAYLQGVPIVNYGVLIASLHGILERAIAPFEQEIEG